MTRRTTDTAPGKSAEAEPKRKRTNPIQFMGQVRQEARKVTWTPRRETIVSTVMVLIMSTLAALFFLLVDFGISETIDFVLRLGA
ncbi:MAG: preprotein translocase subunit SecE [Maricaulaceae bacterium]|nr:preprotein translocase subunit SecE [Maricaulaceae bacterium]